MTRRLQDERGITLPEVLVVSLILVIVLGAVLGAFSSFQRATRTNERLNEVQDSVRVAVDSVTRELRNLASPVNDQPQSILRADPNGKDLIFLSVAGQKPAGSLNTRNTRQVRYCLDGAGTVWRAQQTWTTPVAPPVPGDTACPGSWPVKRVLVPHVTNASRPMFTYNSTTLTAITAIAVSLFVDTDPGRSPKEVALQSAVFLRNQNRVPAASFDMQVSGNTLVLNGSESSDPEGRALEFYWYDDATSPGNLCGPLPAGVPTAGCVGRGLVFNYTPAAPGNRTVSLLVTDPAGLQGRAPSQTACVGDCS